MLSDAFTHNIKLLMKIYRLTLIYGLWIFVFHVLISLYLFSDKLSIKCFDELTSFTFPIFVVGLVIFNLLMIYDIGRDDLCCQNRELKRQLEKEREKKLEVKDDSGLPVEKKGVDTFPDITVEPPTKVKKISKRRMKVAHNRLFSLRGMVNKLQNQLMHLSAEHERAGERFCEAMMRQGFYNRCLQNRMKLKALVRIAEESEKHSYGLELDDVIEMLHDTKIARREMAEYRRWFEGIYPDAMKRIQRCCKSFSQQEEMYFMFVAIGCTDSMMREVLGIGSEKLKKIRARLCPFFGLDKEDAYKLDDKVKAVMFCDK